MLERDDLDSVDVCLHNNYHASATIAALEAGKNVYCEKPISLTIDEGNALIQAVRHHGRIL